MTETTGTTPAPNGATPKRPERRWMLLAGMAAGVAVLAIGIAAFAASGDDDPQPVTEQVTAARQACQHWLDSDSARPGPGAGWCDDMAGWMSGHMGDGQMMMGSGMWASPEAMRDVCTRAMSDVGTADGDYTRWCDQMVDWMSQHADDWGN
jgi:hypothetical protein